MGTEHSTEAYHLAHSKYKAHNPKLWGWKGAVTIEIKQENFLMDDT